MVFKLDKKDLKTEPGGISPFEVQVPSLPKFKILSPRKKKSPSKSKKKRSLKAKE
jgi:hypothetical protein